MIYEKPIGTKELRAERQKESVSSLQTQATSSIPSSSLQISSAYKKEDGVLDYSLICIISGGTKRECDFLNELRKKNTFKSVEVIFISTQKGEGGLTPIMMQEEYKTICKEGYLKHDARVVRLENVDKIYMFTDVDHYEGQLKKILAKEESRSPIWIISNPCFEIWLYYCYRNNPHEDLRDVKEGENSQRSSTLKRVNGTFNNGGGLDPRKAFKYLKDGIIHSEQHYQETDGIPDVLSTQMHLFAKDVLIQLGDDYNAFVRSNLKFDKSRRCI